MYSRSTNTTTLPNQTIYLLGRRLTLMTAPAIVEAIATAITLQQKITVGHYNVHGFNLSMQLPWFHNFLERTDIIHCDGMGILKTLNFLGMKLPQQYRVSYSSLMPALLDECNRRGLSLFLLGAKPDELARAITNLRQQYPYANFLGRDGYFPHNNRSVNQQIVAMINEANPDILLVGMGMPIQEEWVLKNRHHLNAKVVMWGGAVIDRLAGKVSDCPHWIAQLGLEWLYRLIQEPHRLGARYLFGNLAFVSQVLLAKSVNPTRALTREYSDPNLHSHVNITADSIFQRYSRQEKAALKPSSTVTSSKTDRLSRSLSR